MAGILMKIFAIAVIANICLQTSTEALNILGVLPFGAHSHYIIGAKILQALARKGHKVTVITPYPLKQPMDNYDEIPIPNAVKVLQVSKDDLLNTVNRNIVQNIINFHGMGLKVTEAVLQEPGVQKLLLSNQTFDITLIEVFLSEALYGLAEHFNAPMVAFSSFGAIAWNTDMVGSPSPPSYVPNAMLPFGDRMTLLQRIANQGYLTFERALIDFYYLPKQAELYNRHFPQNKRNMYEVRKNAAAVFVNQHVSLSAPRPYMPNQIEVGGLHINRKRTPLPEDIQKFIDEAEHGVIYFSMGSNLQSKNLPMEKRKAILETFRGIKQRVLWKFEDSKLADKPDNVFIKDWYPQDDILAHKNVRLFITHGGLLSTMESIYHGKPVVGIPVFADQFLNMARAEQNGFGVMLDYKNLTVDAFTSGIKRILENPSYTKKVRDMSARYKDQPIEPLDLAVHWMEHIARHDGKYLHCAGLDLNFIEYHNIDVMIILYGGILLLLVLVVLLIRFVLRTMCQLVFKKDKKLKRQ
ncbi:UDP-glycosyltransferase UGT5-like [Teleopsis dalmanni]|uniref:UDP-glycosyltransferase UGT5-like n=1 Tax=Teleopsis dalmanni TaxID=139649 RepID=UPI0018CE6C5D|nr:UDP-glycosyltransferase UGT5-like [Teleopsis dalmanni]XP_037945449.1 UDP-glycosyltransferase UGT5-like [Teleopsis dalmanni]